MGALVGRRQWLGQVVATVRMGDAMFVPVVWLALRAREDEDRLSKKTHASRSIEIQRLENRSTPTFYEATTKY